MTAVSIQSDIPTAAVVKRQIAAGYKERRDYLLGLFIRMVVKYTPVDEGEARGAWRVSVGGPLDVDNHVRVLDPSGEDTIQRQIAILKSVPAFADVHISNTAPHFEALEGGHSGQAPVGVLRVMVPAFNGMFKDVV